MKVTADPHVAPALIMRGTVSSVLQYADTNAVLRQKDLKVIEDAQYLVGIHLPLGSKVRMYEVLFSLFHVSDVVARPY